MIQELHAGDRQIPASGWNEMRAAVQGITPGQQQYQSGRLNPVYITIKNVTGADLPAFSVVKLSGATYSSRTGDTFINQAIANGVELNGDTPAAATDTVAITQAACAAGEFVKAIVSGATACIINKAANINYQYAAPVAGQTGYLTGSDVVTGIKVLWVASGTGDKEAYILLDNVAEGEYFIINPGNDGTQTATHTPSIFTKGSLHYISWSGTYNAWIPNIYNEAPSTSTMLTRPPGAKLVVCQIDAPNSAAECRIPYFTPESNMGVTPTYTDSVAVVSGGDRCGVKPGEHSFTSKCYDYRVMEGGYLYEPSFVATVQAQGQTGGNNQLYIDINNNQYECTAPTYDPTLADNSGPSYADIWPLDYITVLFDCQSYTATALDYPRDYPEGTIMPWYRPNPWTSPALYVGRGWVQYIPTGGQGEITAVNIDKNGAHYNAAGDCIYVEAGVNDKIAVKEGSLCFVEKVKTNAIL